MPGPEFLRQGMTVAVVLAVLTIAEFVFAVEVDNTQVRFGGLAITALAKAWLIGQYFMHFARLWKGKH